MFRNNENVFFDWFLVFVAYFWIVIVHAVEKIAFNNELHIILIHELNQKQKFDSFDLLFETEHS